MSLNRPEMKTARLGPRILGFASIIIWLVSVYFGTTALAKSYDQPQGILQSFISPGTKYWGLMQAKDCIGLFEATFTTKPYPQIRLNGSVEILLGQTPRTLALNAELDFTPYKKLEQVRGTVSFAGSSILVNPNPDAPDSLVVEIKTPQQKKTSIFPLPQPTYLTEERPNNYAFRLPKHIEQLLLPASSDSAAAISLPGVRFQLLSEIERDSCQSVLATPGETRSSGLNIGNYLGLLTHNRISPLNWDQKND